MVVCVCGLRRDRACGGRLEGFDDDREYMCCRSTKERCNRSKGRSSLEQVQEWIRKSPYTYNHQSEREAISSYEDDIDSLAQFWETHAGLQLSTALQRDSCQDFLNEPVKRWPNTKCRSDTGTTTKHSRGQNQ